MQLDQIVIIMKGWKFKIEITEQNIIIWTAQFNLIYLKCLE